MTKGCERLVLAFQNNKTRKTRKELLHIFVRLLPSTFLHLNSSVPMYYIVSERSHVDSEYGNWKKAEFMRDKHNIGLATKNMCMTNLISLSERKVPHDFLVCPLF